MTDGNRMRRQAHPFAEVPKPPPRAFDPARRQGRLVVALVASIIVGMTAVVAAIGLYYSAFQTAGDVATVTIGPFELLLSNAVPPVQMVAMSLLVMVVLAAVTVALEAIAAVMPVNPRRQLLSSYRPRVTTSTEEPLRITVLVPAHNEEASLPGTLASLAEQTRPPDRVVVVADNCTDGTVEIARRMGHGAFETVGNTHKKGGALNQVLSHLLPTLGDSDLVMVMDADTKLGPQYLEVAHRRMSEDPELGAIGGLFYGDEGNGMLGRFQRNEYARYSLQVRARHGRLFVLTGTASAFRAEVLKDVAAGRGVFVPGDPGKVYDTSALTEDNELTLALKSLGVTMTSPPECKVVTEIMPTWRNLWVQRKRWQRGAVENLAAYGMTRATARYWLQQIGLGYGAVAFSLFLSTFAITILAEPTTTWILFWVILGLVFLVERVLTVWSAGWRSRLLAALLFPELCYAVFLHFVFIKCLFDITVGRRTTWGHVQHSAEAAPQAGDR